MDLRLLQLGDSALPIGGYSHSWGLEAAIERGLVRDPLGLEAWTRSWLRHAVGPLEGVVVAAVCRAVRAGDWSAAREANELLRASLTPSTLRHASRDLGGQMLSLAEAWPWAANHCRQLRALSGEPGALATGGTPRWRDSDVPPVANAPGSPGFTDWHHAAVFATLAAAAEATPSQALTVFLHQTVLGVIGAGVRAIPIGHTHGQQLLARLHEDLRSLVNALADRELASAGSFCPAYEMLCHAQAGLYTRLFRS